MKTHFQITLAAVAAVLLVFGTSPVTAQEGAGIFKSEQGQEISPDQGIIEDEGFAGEYDQNSSDDWWYDKYIFHSDPQDPEVRQYYTEEDTMDWYSGDNYYTGEYDATWNDDDWFYDAYDDTGNEGFWDF